MSLFIRCWALVMVLLSTACSTPTPPQGTTVVDNFNVQRFAGRWYEIARLDHSFERGLERVSATYTLQPDGSVGVVNRGYNPDRGMWQSIDGTALFTGSPTRGALKVSFFGPFYGGYNILYLDKDYRLAVICGPDRNYLWLLARAPVISQQQKQQLLDNAARQGFNTGNLIWVRQP